MEGNFKILLGFFIFAVLALAFIRVVANDQVAVTTLSRDNQSINLDTATSGTGKVTQTKTTGLEYFGNTTCNTDGGVCVTIGTDVNLSRNGTVWVNKAVFNSSGPYNVVFGYEGANYLANSTARTIVGFNTLFFAIFILLVGIGVAYKSYPEMFG